MGNAYLEAEESTRVDIYCPKAWGRYYVLLQHQRASAIRAKSACSSEGDCCDVSRRQLPWRSEAIGWRRDLLSLTRGRCKIFVLWL
jgi:hypothetical protein